MTAIFVKEDKCDIVYAISADTSKMFYRSY
jgi:hypothetical protein